MTSLPAKTQRWLDDDVDKYWLHDPEGEKKTKVRLKDLKARLMLDEQLAPVFHGLSFFRHSSFPPKESEIKALVECAGGMCRRCSVLPRMHTCTRSSIFSYVGCR